MRCQQKSAGLVQLKEYFKLAKLKIVAMLVFAAFVSAAVAGKGRIEWDKLLILAVAGGLASIGSSFLNNYFDKDIDAVMDRTKNRPLPKGEIDSKRVLYAGVLLIASALIISSKLNFLASIFILLGALVYVGVYTLWLKRRSSLNIVIGGLSGAFAALAGWTTITQELSLAAILMALLIFIWTPSHFWCFAILHSENYRKARIPMLPVVLGSENASKYILANTIILTLVSLLLYFQGTFGQFYLIASLALGAIFIYLNIKQILSPSLRVTWINYKFSGAYLLVLLSAMVMDIYI